MIKQSKGPNGDLKPNTCKLHSGPRCNVLKIRFVDVVQTGTHMFPVPCRNCMHVLLSTCVIDVLTIITRKKNTNTITSSLRSKPRWFLFLPGLALYLLNQTRLVLTFWDLLLKRSSFLRHPKITFSSAI